MSDGITPLTPAQAVTQEQQAAKERYLQREAIAIDVEANVLFGGSPDETISSRCARDALKGYRIGRWISKFLDLFQKNHGADAQAGDMERAQAVIALEENSGDIPK